MRVERTDGPPTLADLLGAVVEMRKAQKAYFRTRQASALTWSKEAEAKVDALLAALVADEQPAFDLTG